MDLAVKIKEKTSKLVHENSHTRVLVTHVKVTNNSKNILRLKNGDELGIVKLAA